MYFSFHHTDTATADFDSGASDSRSRSRVGSSNVEILALKTAMKQVLKTETKPSYCRKDRMAMVETVASGSP